MKQNRAFRRDFLVFGLIAAITLGIGNGLQCKDNPYQWQETVDRMGELLSTHKKHPNAVISRKETTSVKLLDVNQFFKILTHIRMTRGFDLDYVYARGGLGSEPILYARKSASPRLKTLNDLADYSERHIRWPHNYYDYLEKVVVKGKLEGYFELVVLHIMGGQFYLTWHCLYNDKTIVCDPDKLPALWESIRDPMEEEIVPPEVREDALALDFTPKVNVLGNTVVVQVVVFTKWGGFLRESYYLAIGFPHKIHKIEKETLVPYDCGWCY